jgi:predicted metal-binding membrane protein
VRALSTGRPFTITAALCFAASAAVTAAWCGSMASMEGMAMPGGWTMSMAWMRMPGQGWPGAFAAFLGMWAVMMIAMMLPALVPMLARYREAVGPVRATRLDGLTLRVAAGYFCVWFGAGLAVYPPGVALAELAMRVRAASHAVPVAMGIAAVLVGAWQLSAWKTRQLACCRETIDCCRPPAATASAAWRHGLDLGARCLRCCAPLTALLLVLGVMELRMMALITAAIVIERLAPWGGRAARVTGALILAAGVIGVARCCVYPG